MNYDRIYAAFWLIVYFPAAIAEPIYKELRRAWRNLSIRSQLADSLAAWRDYWRETVRGDEP